MTWRIEHGDCLDVMRGMDAASVDAIVTDPPYGLEFMGRDWDSFGGGAKFTKPGIGERETAWPSFTDNGFGGVNPTCVACGGRLRGKKKCACEQPDWRVKGVEISPKHQKHSQMLHFQQSMETVFTEALRVAKPGAHLLAFGGTRTYHRLTCAIEDAGWEIRDCIMWVYGSGFPKSLDVSKAIDKAGGAELNYPDIAKHIRSVRQAAGISVAEMASWFPYKEVTKNWERTDAGQRIPSEVDYRTLVEKLGADPSLETRRAAAEREVLLARGAKDRRGDGTVIGLSHRGSLDITAPATPAAARWQGFGTALKPAYEPIIVARKPLAGTVAANVLRHGTGAINVDGCRVGTTKRVPGSLSTTPNAVYGKGLGGHAQDGTEGGHNPNLGRWPSNLIHDGSDEVVALFPDSNGSGAARTLNRGQRNDEWGMADKPGDLRNAGVGSAARFFYCAKAGRQERFAYLTCNCEAVKLCVWVKQDQGQGVKTDSTSPDLDTSEATSTGDSRSSTSQSGKASTDLFRSGTEYITSTETSKTIASPTSNSSRLPSTSESTPDAKSEQGSGSSRAVFAGECFQSLPSTSICPPKDGRFTGVVVGATSPLSSGVSKCEGCGSEVRKTAHPTQKPETLMRYLCRLVTPPGGIVLDPFCGSGSTGKAAIAEGFGFIGIEREADYVAIAERRIRESESVDDQGKLAQLDLFTNGGDE